MSEIEVELTYLAKEIPKDLNKFECKRIVDIYFPKSDLDRKIRLRQNGDKYEITKKYIETKLKIDELIKKVNDIMIFTITGEVSCNTNDCSSCNGCE